ncbi:MAG: uroporphyrinogen decarboxylase [Oscillospiraceae bacterium]|nr:uroporphyrinogen decarboxylase [Oscillospiraceae bacterium]
MSATAREVMDSVINRIPPERFPTTASVFSVSSRAAGYTYEQFANLDPLEQAQFEYNVVSKNGTDHLSGSMSGTLLPEALGGKIKFREHGSPDVDEPMIENISDIDKIDLSRIRNYHHYQKSLESARYLFDMGNGVYNNYVHTWGVFTQAGLFYGEEKLMRACLRDKPAVNALLEFTFEVFKYTQDEFIDIGATIGSCADPTASGDMISKRVFEEFAAPYLKKVYDWYKSRGLHTSLHICGNIDDRIDLIANTNVDILSVDHKVDIVKAAQVLNGRAVIGGNADPVSVILDQTPADVRAFYEDLVVKLDGYPYAIMPGCSVPTSTPIANVLAMVEVAHAHKPGKYN